MHNSIHWMVVCLRLRATHVYRCCMGSRSLAHMQPADVVSRRVSCCRHSELMHLVVERTMQAHSDALLIPRVPDPYREAVQCVRDKKRAHPNARCGAGC
jgi:hypothetical protein